MDFPDLSLVQITFLAHLYALQESDEPVLAKDLRASVRPSFDIARGPMFYATMNRLDGRGLVDKYETTTPGTDRLPAVAYLLTDAGLEALEDFREWSRIISGKI